MSEWEQRRNTSSPGHSFGVLSLNVLGFCLFNRRRRISQMLPSQLTLERWRKRTSGVKRKRGERHRAIAALHQAASCCVTVPQWEQVTKAWKRLPAPSADDQHNAGLPHVYVYAMVHVHELSTNAHMVVLQIRNQRPNCVGLFGGEVELWRPKVLQQWQASHGDPMALSRVLSDALTRELHEELNVLIHPKDRTSGFVWEPCQEAHTPRWHAINVATHVHIHVQSFATFVRHATYARDFGTETLALLPIRNPTGVVPNVTFQPYHQALWQSLIASCPAVATKS